MNTITQKLSLIPIYTRSCYNDTTLSTATSFIYERYGRFYFVTNWHVVSGRSPYNKKCLSSTQGIPNKLICNQGRIHQNIQSEPSPMVWVEFSIPLYKKDQSGEDVPSWFEHPIHREKVDVVAIPFDLFDQKNLPLPQAVNNEKNDPLLIGPGIDVFILGFPFGIRSSCYLPVWKRGSIASEPYCDVDQYYSAMYVDTATREGMSGSPVYAYASGLIILENCNMRSGVGHRFLGVYSGRIGADDEYKAQLGIVWRSSVIDEIIDGHVCGHSSFTM